MTELLIESKKLEHYEEGLKSFEPPKKLRQKIPYILFGSWKVVHRRDENKQFHKPKVEYSVFAREFKGRVPERAHVQALLNKGYPILGYYFPTKADLTSAPSEHESGFIRILRTSESHDPYLEIRTFCEHEMARVKGNAGAHAALEKEKSENALLKQRLAEMEVKGGKNGRTNTSKD